MNQITDTVFEKLMDIDKYEIEEVDKNDDKDEFIEEYFNTGSYYYTIRDVEDETYTMRDMCEILDYVNKNHKEMCSEPYDFTGIIDLLNVAIYFKAKDLIQYEWERVQEYLDMNEKDESEEVEPAQ